MSAILTAATQKKLAEYLAKFSASRGYAACERRAEERFVPFIRSSILRLPDGREHCAKIRDLSASGVALETTAPAEIGSAIFVGRTRAVVTRRFEGGVSAQFVSPFRATEISEATIL